MKVDEGRADRATVGHFAPYLTHRLDPAENSVQRSDDYQINQIQTDWAEHKNEDVVDFDGSQLTSLGRTTPLNPYLNIQVDKVLIKNHNDIWGARIVAFIRDLIAISTTPIIGTQ